MDIEIKNESQALNICGNAKSDKIKQLNSHISTLNSLINKIKVSWSSTGSDQSTYIAELEKQANNLQEISNQSYRFFDVIERYVDSTQKTSQKTVGSGGSSGGGSSSSGSGTGAGMSAGAAQAAGAIKKTASSMAGIANGGSSSGKGSGTASGSYTPTLDPGVPKTNGQGIVGTVGVGGTTGGSTTGGTSTGGSSYTGGTGSTSGGGSSTISSVHGGGTAASSLNGTGTGTAGGEAGSGAGSGASAGISAAAGTNGTVSTSASEIFTSDKLDGVVPKLSVPMSSGATSGSKAVPIVSGGIAAGAVGLGAAAILKKTPAAKPEKNLEIDAWEETKEAQVEVEAATMEQKLGELTFEDIIM